MADHKTHQEDHQPFQFDGHGSHMDKLVRWLRDHHADDVILSYPDDEGRYSVNLTGADVERVSAHAASRYAEAFRQLLPAGEVTGELGFAGFDTRIVAIVGVSTLSSYVTYVALPRLGLSPMFISPRLADDGYAHLLRVTGCHTVLAAGPSLDTIRRVKKTYGGVLDVVPMLDDDEVVRGLTSPYVDLAEPDCSPGHVIHTGGTTGLPKPVGISVNRFMNSVPRAWDSRLPSMLCTVPVFHSYGLGTFLRALRGPTHLCILNPYRPVTASIIWKALDDTSVEMLLTVPYVLKFFADIEGGVQRLARLTGVRCGGSATPDDLGDLLIRNGVKFNSLYGQTEAGPLMIQAGPGLDEWQWLTPQPSCENHIKFEKVGDDMYHLVVLAGLESLKVSDRPDGSYGTKDLFRPHPDNEPGSDTRAGRAKWKFIARQGDIIVLVNGENADPTPIEHAVMLDPHIQMAVAFGAGHERLGLLVIPSDKALGLSAGEVIQRIRPALDQGNKLASDYAKISHDDIIVKPVGTPYPQTAKMTLQRPVLNKLFADDIEAHYASRERASGAVDSLSDDDVRVVVRRVVGEELQANMPGARLPKANGDAHQHAQGGIMGYDDDDDFFSMGMDSLQSSLVRKRLLREIPLPEDTTFATNVVFEFPSVKLLGEHINNLRQRKSATLGRDPEVVSRAMLDKYSALVTEPGRRDSAIDVNGGVADQPASVGRVVILTGATGYIGIQLLNNLLNRPDISRIYCLVRTRQERDHKTAAQRIHDALDNSNLTADLPAASMTKLTCLSANLSAADLGLGPAERGELEAAVTDVIHNAWSVNFNMSLESFEPNVASVANLLNLARAQQSPQGGGGGKTFVFISSVAAVGAGRGGSGKVVQEKMYGWAEASPYNGYGQSKWIAEHMCAAASTVFPGPVRVLRVGQVSGDTKHGIWNPAEAIPAMVQSALTIGVLPRMVGDKRNALRWLPSDNAAAAITDLTFVEAKNEGGAQHRGERLAVFHVASPLTSRWNEDVLPALERAGLEFRVAPEHEWVQALSDSDGDIEKNPPYKLIEHFRRSYGRRGASGAVERPDEQVAGYGDGSEHSWLDMTQSLKCSPALRNASPVGSELIVRYARFWMNHWGNK